MVVSIQVAAVEVVEDSQTDTYPTSGVRELTDDMGWVAAHRKSYLLLLFSGMEVVPQQQQLVEISNLSYYTGQWES